MININNVVRKMQIFLLFIKCSLMFLIKKDDGRSLQICNYA